MPCVSQVKCEAYYDWCKLAQERVRVHRLPWISAKTDTMIVHGRFLTTAFTPPLASTYWNARGIISFSYSAQAFEMSLFLTTPVVLADSWSCFNKGKIIAVSSIAWLLPIPLFGNIGCTALPRTQTRGWPRLGSVFELTRARQSKGGLLLPLGSNM